MLQWAQQQHGRGSGMGVQRRWPNVVDNHKWQHGKNLLWDGRLGVEFRSSY